MPVSESFPIPKEPRAEAQGGSQKRSGGLGRARSVSAAKEKHRRAATPSLGGITG